jgi:hypothetical protein
MANDNLLFVRHDFDGLADQTVWHQIACGPEPNTAAFIDRAAFQGAQRWTAGR